MPERNRRLAVRPDDITHDEFDAALLEPSGHTEKMLAAQNALRDRRVIEEARRDERERIARMVEEISIASWRFHRLPSDIAAAIRGGETPPAPPDKKPANEWVIALEIVASGDTWEDALDEAMGAIDDKVVDVIGGRVVERSSPPAPGEGSSS